MFVVPGTWPAVASAQPLNGRDVGAFFECACILAAVSQIDMRLVHDAYIRVLYS